MAKRRSPLLLQLMARLGDVEIKEGYIPRDGGRDIYGLWTNDGTIIINPIPHTVDSVLHELLHELKPDYNERAVRSVVGKLMKQLSEKEVQAIYLEYRR